MGRCFNLFFNDIFLKGEISGTGPAISPLDTSAKKGVMISAFFVQ
jgi:hypothetical protein